MSCRSSDSNNRKEHRCSDGYDQKRELGSKPLSANRCGLNNRLEREPYREAQFNPSLRLAAGSAKERLRKSVETQMVQRKHLPRMTQNMRDGMRFRCLLSIPAPRVAPLRPKTDRHTHLSLL